LTWHNATEPWKTARQITPFPSMLCA
jgi:hypothetical protein